MCGTACRLAQCLAQVGFRSEDGKNGGDVSSGSSSHLPQLLKDVADTWEGIARAIGVSTTAVKSQMLLLLQETHARQSFDNENSIKLEGSRVSSYFHLYILGKA